MTSWANRSVGLPKAKEAPSHPFFTPSDEFASSTLAFLYWSLYHQRSADPFYIYDPQDDLQSVFKRTPNHHFLKELSTGQRLSASAIETSSLLSSLSLPTLKRMVASTFVLASQTQMQIDSLLASFGLTKQVFDVGIVLDVSGSVPTVIQTVKALQGRLGKKTLSLFIATDSLPLLQEFAQKGDPSWTYKTLIRLGAPQTRQSNRLKFLAELQILRTVGALVTTLRSPTGKLLYLTNQGIVTPSLFVSWDGSSWKPIE